MSKPESRIAAARFSFLVSLKYLALSKNEISQMKIEFVIDVASTDVSCCTTCDEEPRIPMNRIVNPVERVGIIFAACIEYRRKDQAKPEKNN
jgi:hypothetical protein